MTIYLYSPWKCGVTNYDQNKPKLMDVKFLGATQPGMEKWGQVKTLRYTPNDSTLLACVQSTDKLYVLGHCEAGAKTIESGFGGSELSASDLADRLKENGLSAVRRMTIKLYACSGGKGINGGLSFAQRLLVQLRKRKYYWIKVHAYTRTVTQKSKVEGRGFHKWAENDQGAIIGRAKDYRVTIG